MLKQMGMLTKAVGIDINFGSLAHASKRAGIPAVCQANAERLPFADASFSTVICNQVLCAIPGGASRAIREGARVLKKGGSFVATVPTDDFEKILPVPRMLGHLSRLLERRYIGRLNSRLPHITACSNTEWRRALGVAGLEVVRELEFFKEPQAATWNILSLQLFRIMSLVRIFDSSLARRFMVWAFLSRLPGLQPEVLPADGKCGCLLIIARKAP